MNNNKNHQQTYAAFFKHVTAIENLWPEIEEILRSGDAGKVKNIFADCGDLGLFVQKVLLHTRDRIK